MSGLIILVAAARAAEEKRKAEEYHNDFLKLGFELKKDWVSSKIIKYFVPAKFFIKKYFFNAEEKRWAEAQKFGLGKIIEEDEYGFFKETNDLLRTTDYLLCKEGRREGYYNESIYYILTGEKIETAYYGMPLSELGEIKKEQDEKFKNSQRQKA